MSVLQLSAGTPPQAATQCALASCHAEHCKCQKLICSAGSVMAFLSHAGSQ